MVGVSVTKVAEIINVVRSTVSKIFKEYRDSLKNASNKSKREWKSLSEHDRWSLKRNVIKNKKTTTSKVTVEMNIALTETDNIQTARDKLHNQNFSGRVKIQKPFVNEQHAVKRKNNVKLVKCELWINGKKSFCSDKSRLSPFPTTGRIYVWERHHKRTTENVCCQELNMEGFDPDLGCHMCSMGLQLPWKVPLLPRIMSTFWAITSIP